MAVFAAFFPGVLAILLELKSMNEIMEMAWGGLLLSTDLIFLIFLIFLVVIISRFLSNFFCGDDNS